MMHLYAQYFHPTTLLERVRDVRFYRQPRTMFKGFKVPEWATAKEAHGWEIDMYSRQAWDNAMHDFHSEWTPTQVSGERQEPNVLQWLRFEQWGCGFGSRLFYNEVPVFSGVKSWWRMGGHFLENEKDQREQDRRLHSFTQGRAAYKAEWDALAELAPEIIKKEDIVFPHEQSPRITNEPHFRRVWQHYREHTFKLRYAMLVDSNSVSKADADAFSKFVGLNGTPAFTLFISAKLGKLEHLKDDAGYQATTRVLSALGFDNIQFDTHTAEPLEEQFWQQFDGLYQLSEHELRQDLHLIVLDPSNRAKVEALLAAEEQASLN